MAADNAASVKWDTVKRAASLLDGAGIGHLSLGGGWGREMLELDPPRPHGDIDFVLVDADLTLLDRFLADQDEVAVKRSHRKRAFVLDGVLVELFLVQTTAFTASEE